MQGRGQGLLWVDGGWPETSAVHGVTEARAELIARRGKKKKWGREGAGKGQRQGGGAGDPGGAGDVDVAHLGGDSPKPPAQGPDIRLSNEMRL